MSEYITCTYVFNSSSEELTVGTCRFDSIDAYNQWRTWAGRTLSDVEIVQARIPKCMVDEKWNWL